MNPFNLKWWRREWRRNWASITGMFVSFLFYLYNIFVKNVVLRLGQQQVVCPTGMVGCDPAYGGLNVPISYLWVVSFVAFLVVFVVRRNR
jgi:hypothetical protein